MLLPRADARLGAGQPDVPVGEPAVGRERLRVARGSAEPVVPVELLLNALPDAAAVEQVRPLLPVGYAAGADAYRAAVERLDARDLTTHYQAGLRFFHDELVPNVKGRLSALTGGAAVGFEKHAREAYELVKQFQARNESVSYAVENFCWAKAGEAQNAPAAASTADAVSDA